MKRSIQKIIYSKRTPKILRDIWQNTKNYFEFKKAHERLVSYRKYHLACGNNLLKGWANIDLYGPSEVIRWDLRREFPVADSTVDFVYTEHFIEHIERNDAVLLLKEIYRMLKIGACVRLTTPSLEKVVDNYNKNIIDEWKDVCWSPATTCQMMNEFFRRWDHKYTYDYNELKRVLEEAGFSKITPANWGESDISEFIGIEKRPYHGEIIIEATK